MTFEGWNPRYYGDAMALPGDALAHFRTKGSKNGVRRYQQPDGTWTPLGLRLRKAREGWGETRADRKLARAKAKTQRIKAKEAARTKIAKEREKARAEKAKARLNRRNNLADLSDDELRQKINRAKMEQQYRDLTKNPLLKTGQNLIKSYVEGRDKREDRKLERERNAVEALKAQAEKLRAKADISRARGDTIRSVQQTKQEKYRYKTKKKDVKGGLATERNADRLRAKKELRESSVWNKFWTRHNQKKLSDIRVSEEVRKSASNILGQLEGKRAIDAYNNPVRAGKLGRIFAPKQKKGRSRLTYDLKEATDLRKEELKTRQAEANAKKTIAEAERAKTQLKSDKQKNKQKKKNKGGNS